ncbi:hypothetical protein GCM10009570_26340 [Dietzia natronolimnaea]
MGENQGGLGGRGALGLGGQGGRADGDCYSGGGGGGGGGHYGGGGGGGGGAGWSFTHAKMTGGGGGGGGGGSNYASPSVTVLANADGGSWGSGKVNISYQTHLEQFVTFTSTPTAVDRFHKVTATASSGLPVEFSVDSNCYDLGGGQIMFREIGTCSVTASQAGNEFFAAAESTQTIAFLGLPQPLAFDNAAPERPKVGEIYYVGLISGENQNPKAIRTATGSCNNDDDDRIVRFTAPGPCVVSAVAPSYDIYAASEQITRTIDVQAAFPPVVFTSEPPTDAVVGDTYKPTATGGAQNSGDIVFTTEFQYFCTVDEYGVVTFLQPGSCTIFADQFSPTHDPAQHARQFVHIEAAPTTPDGPEPTTPDGPEPTTPDGPEPTVPAGSLGSLFGHIWTE